MGYSRSRARCVPLQYPSSATRGVKLAPGFNKQAQNQKHIVLAAPLQEKRNILDHTLNSFSKESTGPVSQSESGMFYELLNRKKMECEKYQDCSWFQQSPLKPDCNSKLSLAETVGSFTEADEFDLPMQYADAQTSPWGDKYLEVFTDDILLEEKFKLEEKNKNFISNENVYACYKADEDEVFNSCNINFGLKKTDSVDSMKNISSTNPAEVIPISYKERLNYSNYGLTKLDKVKSEVKKEVESYSPELSSYVMDSDDSDLNIGREEVVEEMNSVEDLQLVNEKESMTLGQFKSDVSLSAISKTPGNLENEEMSNIKCKKLDNNNFKTANEIMNQTTGEKLDLNLDINKLNFEQSLNIKTPDLDFMDLVDFINEEMRQENISSINSASNDKVKDSSATNQHLISNENQINNEKIEPSIETESYSSQPLNESLVNNLISSDLNGNSTVDLKELSDAGISIAERIKTSAKRKTRKSIISIIDTESEGSLDEDEDEDEDEDDEYDYRESMAKRRCTSINKRIKSSFSESTGNSNKGKEESSSYRERRDKNNEASRRSRQNRKARERHMYKTLEEEERRNVKLKAEADVLEKQVTSLRQLLLQVVLQKGGGT